MRQQTQHAYWVGLILLVSALQSFGDSGTEPTIAIRSWCALPNSYILEQTKPVYPAEAKAKHIQGKVKIHFRIDKTGTPQEVVAVEGPLALRQASVDAVKQWKFKPYLLNNKPVRVETDVYVNYVLPNSNKSRRNTQ